MVPNILLFCKSRSLNDVSAPIFVDSVPSKSFDDNAKATIDVMEYISSGIGPLKSFARRSKCVRYSREPNDEGRNPDKKFACMNSLDSFFNFLISVGIVPSRLLVSREIEIKFVSKNRPVGIRPSKPLLSK